MERTGFIHPSIRIRGFYLYLEEQIEELEARVKSAEDRAIAAEADLASFLGESPLWISLEGFNKVSDRERAWRRAAIEAQGFLKPINPIWQLIEQMKVVK